MFTRSSMASPDASSGHACSLPERTPPTSTEPFPPYGVMASQYISFSEGATRSNSSSAWTWCASRDDVQFYGVLWDSLWDSAEASDAEFVRWQALLSELLPERDTQAIRTLVQAELREMQQMEAHRQNCMRVLSSGPATRSAVALQS